MNNLEREEIIQQRAHNNIAEFMDKGPGLRLTTRAWVIAKDPTNHRVKLGGLGGMGVGRMWFDEADWHREDPTYADAPIEDSTGKHF